MVEYIPFIHKIKEKKKQELIPLQIELYEPPPALEEEKDAQKVIVIQL